MARRCDTTALSARAGDHDALLILSLDARGDIVGEQLAGAADVPLWLWSAHPDCGMIPCDLLQAVDD